MHPTSLLMAKSVIDTRLATNIALPNSALYLSANRVHVETSLGVVNDSTAIMLSTSDGSAVPVITYSLEVAPSVGADLALSDNVVDGSPDPIDTFIIGISFNPSTIYDSVGMVHITYVDNSSAVVKVTVYLDLFVVPAGSNLYITETQINFGTIDLSTDAFANIDIHYSGFTPDLANFIYSVEALPNGDTGFIASEIGINPALSIVTITYRANLNYSGSFNIATSLYYDGYLITGCPLQLLATVAGAVPAPDLGLVYTPPAIPAPVGDQTVFSTFKNLTGQPFRVTTYEFTNDTLGEFTVSFPNTLVNYIIAPYELLSVIINYSPKQANLVAPALLLHGSYI